MNWASYQSLHTQSEDIFPTASWFHQCWSVRMNFYFFSSFFSSNPRNLRFLNSSLATQKIGENVLKKMELWLHDGYESLSRRPSSISAPSLPTRPSFSPSFPRFVGHEPNVYPRRYLPQNRSQERSSRAEKLSYIGLRGKFSSRDSRLPHGIWVPIESGRLFQCSDCSW